MNSYGGQPVVTVGTAIIVLLVTITDIEIADKDLDFNVPLKNPSVPKSFISNDRIGDGISLMKLMRN